MKRIVAQPLAAALIALAVLAAACGSSSPSPASAPAATVPTTTATAGTSVGGGTPSAIAVATPTEIPTPAPAVTLPAAETEAPAAVSDVDRLSRRALDFLTAFTNDMSPRASGTEQERAAAEFLAAQLKGIGFRTEIPGFPFETLTTVATLSADGMEAPEVETIPMTRSAEGAATGQLVHVDLAYEEGIPAGGLDGKAVLIRRGEITFEEKVGRVTEAGAVGAIVYNREPGVFGGTLQTRSTIPVVATSMETGEVILDLIEGTEVRATVSVITEEGQSQNVIAEISGTDGRVVVLGGHYDTVPDVPGANDNGSGIASLMVAARQIADNHYPFTVRIIAFGAEELGLYGSRHYVESLTDDERGSIVAMLNYDALAGSEVLGVTGDSELQDIAVELARDAGIELRRRLLPRNASSDHASFLAVDIPAVFFMDNDFSRIHTPDDKLDFINEDLMGQSVYIGLALLDSLAAH